MTKEIDLAKRFKLQIVEDLSEYKFVKTNKNIIPYLFAKKRSILPVEEEEGVVVVAISDPLEFSHLLELELVLNKKIKPIFCLKSKLEEAIEKCYKQKEQTKSIFSSFQKVKNTQAKSNLEEYDLLDSNNENPVIRMLNAIIIEAIQQQASDIHFEPLQDNISLRYRIDGVLQKKSSPPKEFKDQLLTRLKVMSKLDIAEKRRPQDGRLKLKMAGREIDFRVSTMPVVYGERIVLRILDKGNILLGLEKIGMKNNVLTEFKKLITMSEGIILVTGPTGSGKTTTLYSAIEQISSFETNIMTVEDPVEYKLSHIAQIGVNPKIDLTFSTGLRHILRQDPDVIMIGEIRDLETAEIAIQSALTGHLVFSTLHTNDAPSAITRLAEIGIEPYLLSSSIIGVLAQRLVRKICPHCKEAYKPSKEELKKLELNVGHINFYKGKGCKFCFNTGYKGRHGIYELMINNFFIKKQIMKSVESEALKQVAREQKMQGLLQSGISLVKKGITTTSEILRVAKTTQI